MQRDSKRSLENRTRHRKGKKRNQLARKTTKGKRKVESAGKKTPEKSNSDTVVHTENQPYLSSTNIREMKRRVVVVGPERIHRI